MSAKTGIESLVPSCKESNAVVHICSHSAEDTERVMSVVGSFFSGPFCPIGPVSLSLPVPEVSETKY